MITKSVQRPLSGANDMSLMGCAARGQTYLVDISQGAGLNTCHVDIADGFKGQAFTGRFEITVDSLHGTIVCKHMARFCVRITYITSNLELKWMLDKHSSSNTHLHTKAGLLIIFTNPFLSGDSPTVSVPLTLLIPLPGKKL